MTRSWPFLLLHRRRRLPEPPTSLKDSLVASPPPPSTTTVTTTTNESKRLVGGFSSSSLPFSSLDVGSSTMNELFRLVRGLFSYSSDDAGHQRHERVLRTRSWPFLLLHRPCQLPEPPTSLNDSLVASLPPPLMTTATTTTNESKHLVGGFSSSPVLPQRRWLPAP